MDPPPLSAFEGLGGAFDVAGGRPCECRDHRPAHGTRDLADGFELAGRRDGEPGLDDIDVEPRELLRDLELLGLGQRDARRLLAVAQGRVEDPDFVCAGYRFAA